MNEIEHVYGGDVGDEQAETPHLEVRAGLAQAHAGVPSETETGSGQEDEEQAHGMD